jgi:hypothetical protein
MTDTASVQIPDDLPIYCIDCEAEHPWNACPPEGICRYCKTRAATLHFGNALSFTHGGSLNCCALCAAEKQLEHAKERAAAIPELERRIAELRAAP